MCLEEAPWPCLWQTTYDGSATRDRQIPFWWRALGFLGCRIIGEFRSFKRVATSARWLRFRRRRRTSVLHPPQVLIAHRNTFQRTALRLVLLDDEVPHPGVLGVAEDAWPIDIPLAYLEEFVAVFLLVLEVQKLEPAGITAEIFERVLAGARDPI